MTIKDFFNDTFEFLLCRLAGRVVLFFIIIGALWTAKLLSA